MTKKKKTETHKYRLLLRNTANFLELHCALLIDHCAAAVETGS